ncbi:MAG: LacI family transcriptional regulator [Cyclobacteriaceae bacterium]|nr:LacI family transcriptional regulator [Cyclobacteriaceae bacterium]
MKTLKEIAKIAGVSAMTISRYFSSPEKLSKATHDKVKALVDEFQYTPNMLAKSLITNKSHLIGVVIPDIRNPFFSQLYYWLEKILEPMGYSLILCNSRENSQKEKKYLQLLISRQVEGIFLVPVNGKNVELLLKKKRNFVLIERSVNSMHSKTVSSNHYQGAYMAVEHLIKLGHRKIALLCGNTEIKPYRDRLTAYLDALKAFGIPINEEFLCESEITIEASERAFYNLINKKLGITAVFSCNTLMSYGAINAIYKSKLTIPGDISFAAFDELPGIELLIPSITCVRQDTGKLANTAVEMLLRQTTNNEVGPTKIEVPVTLKLGK